MAERFSVPPGPNRTKHSKVIRAWIISYATILLIPILVCSFYTLHSYRLVKDGVRHQQHSALEQTLDSLDNSFSELMRISSNLQLNDYVLSFSYLTEDRMASIHHLYVRELQKDCTSFRAANTLIQSVNLYFPVLHTVVNESTIYTTDLAPYMGSGTISKNAWDKFYQILSKKKGFHLLFNPDNGGLTLIRALVSSTGRTPLSILAFELNQKAFLDEFTRDAAEEDSASFLTDGSDILLCDNPGLMASVSLPGLMEQIRRMEEPASFEWKGDGAVYIVDFLPSILPGFYQVSITDRQIYNSTTDSLLFFLSITLLSCILLGILFTRFYVRRNYRPLMEIVEYIVSDRPEAEQSDEYNLIIQKLLHNRTEIELQQVLLKNEYFHKILSGEIPYDQMTTQALKGFGLDFTEGYFSIALIHVGNYEFIQQHQFSGTKLAEGENLTHFILVNIIKELLLPEHLTLHFCYLHSKVAVVMHCRKTEDFRESVILRHLDTLVEFCAVYYHFELNAGLSLLCESPVRLPLAYSQSGEALECISLFQKAPVYSYSSIRSIEDLAHTALYDSEYIIHLVLTGQVKDIDSYFEQVREKLFSGSHSLLDAKGFVYFAYRTSLKLKLDLCRQYGTDYPKEVDSIDASLFQLPLKDALTKLQETFLFIQAKVKQQNITEKTQLPGQVCRYIENNYFDCNLNLNSIASHFGLTPAYLSSKFKADRNESVIDCLYRIRIDHAARLLEETGLKIADAALMVGFQDSNAFIRVFKKYKGTTPGRYKELQRSP